MRAEEFPQFFVTVTPAKPAVIAAQTESLAASPADTATSRPAASGFHPAASATSPAAPEPPARQASATADGREWYYARGDEELGPVDLEFLKMLVRGGKLGPDDLIWRDPMPEWLPVRSLPGLEPHQPQVNVRSASEAPLQTSGLAVLSLVLGILWLGGLGSLVAIVVGLAALSQIRQSGGRLSGKPIAAAGTALGVIGLTLTAIVAVVLWLESVSAT